MRLFHINQDATASEWTYANGSWIGTEKDEFRIQGAVAGEPVATSQSSDGSGRYVEYMYATTAGNEINSVGRNSAQAGFIQGKLTSFEVDKPEDPKPVLSNEAIIALVLGIVLGVPTLYYARRGIIRVNKREAHRGRWPKTRAVFGRILCVPGPRSKGHGATTTTAGSGSSTESIGSSDHAGLTATVA